MFYNFPSLVRWRLRLLSDLIRHLSAKAETPVAGALRARARVTRPRTVRRRNTDVVGAHLNIVFVYSIRTVARRRRSFELKRASRSSSHSLFDGNNVSTNFEYVRLENYVYVV